MKRGELRTLKPFIQILNIEEQTSVSETAKVSIKIGETAVAAPISMLYKS